ncbi:glycosyltransferase [Burkholderia sp. FERM BP-3421]|jgi:GT2 family glycosyltransferase|uniref:glycosyltransferase n=1 Tax=Burkholderia sp. FERM BP-3421 TaxID=1494466 RepID=UPI002360316A|nr:glycosyltransferase [Burkholderia sp. FERM BP-3421]WDD93197.1 glycosyltransferase [Burkholderia sp. FERM BP-3421]
MHPRFSVTVSIVTFRSEPAMLERTLHSVSRAARFAREAGAIDRPVQVALIDNDDQAAGAAIQPYRDLDDVEVRLISGHGNVGYGRGHNLALAETDSAFHLILNPDVDMEASGFAEAIGFMNAHPDVGLLAPHVRGDDGRMQYLCRRYPSLFDLLLRGFAPAWVRSRFAKRLNGYEMRDVIGERDVVLDPPIVSGCFMFFRTSALQMLQGFDPRYFLYFEDYDLSLRVHEKARIAYVPAVKIVHFGGGAARKGAKHIQMFAASAFHFFNRHGWRWR